MTLSKVQSLKQKVVEENPYLPSPCYKKKKHTFSFLFNRIMVSGHSSILVNAGSNFNVMFIDVSQATKLEQYKAYNRHMMNMCLMEA